MSLNYFEISDEKEDSFSYSYVQPGPANVLPTDADDILKQNFYFEYQEINEAKSYFSSDFLDCGDDKHQLGFNMDHNEIPEAQYPSSFVSEPLGENKQPLRTQEAKYPSEKRQSPTIESITRSTAESQNEGILKFPSNISGLKNQENQNADPINYGTNNLTHGRPALSAYPQKDGEEDNIQVRLIPANFALDVESLQNDFKHQETQNIERNNHSISNPTYDKGGLSVDFMHAYLATDSKSLQTNYSKPQETQDIELIKYRTTNPTQDNNNINPVHFNLAPDFEGLEENSHDQMVSSFELKITDPSRLNSLHLSELFSALSETNIIKILLNSELHSTSLFPNQQIAIEADELKTVKSRDEGEPYKFTNEYGLITGRVIKGLKYCLDQNPTKSMDNSFILDYIRKGLDEFKEMFYGNKEILVARLYVYINSYNTDYVNSVQNGKDNRDRSKKKVMQFLRSDPEFGYFLCGLIISFLQVDNLDLADYVRKRSSAKKKTRKCLTIDEYSPLRTKFIEIKEELNVIWNNDGNDDKTQKKVKL